MADPDNTDPHPSFQAPPIKLKIIANDEVQLAMFALDAAVDQYLGNTEYWFAADAVKLAGEVRIEVVPLGAETAASLEDWVGPLRRAFDTRRVVTSADWRSGVAIVPANAEVALLTTPHPDNGRDLLGLLVVLDTSGRLSSAAWYRSTPPAEGGLAFGSRTWAQPLTLAQKPDGTSTSDPDDVQRADWRYVLMPLP
jgi:hypothetical protein